MSYSYSNNFARILAKENIVIRRSRAASTASFNMKSRVLILPVWDKISEALHDMILVHEVGHALDTPLDPLIKAVKKLDTQYRTDVSKDYINVVEDARIDRAQKARYPGTVLDYAIGYKELHNRDFFHISTVVDVNALPFIDRINLYFKNGHHLGLKFSAVEQILVDRVATTETFDDVVDVVDAIMKYVRVFDVLKGQAEKIVAKFSDDKDEASESGGSSEGGASSEEDGDEETSDDEGTKSPVGGNDSDRFEELKEALEDAETGRKKVLNEVDLPSADTYRNMSKALDNLLSKGKSEPIITNVSMNDYKGVTIPYKKLLQKVLISDEFSRWRDGEKSNVSYMVSEFERKKAADLNKRIRVDKTGVLNMTDIHQYKYSDDIFKRQDIIPEGKNHGLIFLLDWSGSMNMVIHDTIKQLLTLTMFCRMTNIPFDVYIFQSSSSYHTRELSKGNLLVDEASSTMKLSSFVLKNILSSKMTASEYLRMSSFFFDMTRRGAMHGNWDMGSTPLISSLDVFPDITHDFIKDHKVQVPTVFILTDGDSDMPSFGYDTIQREVILNNPKTNKSYTTTLNSRQFLGAMINNLKDMTGSRVVGIHLLDDGSSSCRSRYGVDFGPDGFVVTKESGYDKHYAVKASKMAMKDRNSFWKSYGKKMDSDDLAEAMTVYGKEKISTRFLLKSFIDDISLDRTH